MGLYEDAYEADSKRHEENKKKNTEYFNSLTDKEKFELMWKDYMHKHINDIRL